ncbi:hypothetical protein H6P81_021232 [Aristolochia fimbriata]|uniref:Uncharacterized protein n=1 Tax=Aristolochia fimbriata TaxID=158543 RepID=A0AAV7DTN7_ARIFI|nr:hypothetical protein H6P81_021232 [Aristolochia fimbriata]
MSRRRWRVSLGLLAPALRKGLSPPQAGALWRFVGSPCTGRASARRDGRCGEVVHAGHALKVVLFRQMSRRLVKAVFPPSSTDLPLPCWVAGIPLVLVCFFPERGSSPLMYSPFENPPPTRGRGGYGRAQSAPARIFSSPLSLTLVCSNAGRRKCSWTHVNAAVPMDLVDSQTKSDASTFLLDRRCPRPVLRRLAIGRC